MKFQHVGAHRVLSRQDAIFPVAHHKVQEAWLGELGFVSRGQKEVESLGHVFRGNEDVDVRQARRAGSP